MVNKPSDYVFNSRNECDRLERQAVLQGNEQHLRHFHVDPGARVLEAGCGSGAMARLLAVQYPTAEVLGVDVNPEYIAYAARRAHTAGLRNLSFQVGDLEDLPLPDTSFDVIWSHLVLFFLPKPELALKEFLRLLRPGGQVRIALHDETFLTNHPEDSHLQERLEQVIPKLGDVRLSRKLPLMLRDLGFNNVSVTVELDTIYTVIGAVNIDQRRNVEELLTSALTRISTILGSQQAANDFKSDLLSYLDRSDTSSYTTLWIVGGTK